MAENVITAINEFLILIKEFAVMTMTPACKTLVRIQENFEEMHEHHLTRFFILV